MGRFIGLDVHHDFCEVAIAEGGRARWAGRVATTPEELTLFAQSLAPDDPVVVEATGNALAIARIIAPHVAEVVLAHAKQVRAITELPQMIGTRSAKKQLACRKKECRNRRGSCYYGEPEARTLSLPSR